MIAALLLAPLQAHAGDSLLAGPKNQCSVDDAFPIAGTSGFSNALSALRTNASTYSASNFAEKHALRRIALGARGEDVSIVQFEANFNWGVTRVPVFQEDATYGECPAAYVLGTRPVDMYAYNLGFALRHGRFGAFYASSITFGYPAELAYLRAQQAMGSVVLGGMMSVLVPVSGSWQTQTGSSAYAQDFVAGAVVDLEVGDVRAGYTQSRGWYFSGQDRYVGAFGTVVLRDGLRLVGQARGGLERTPLPEPVEKLVGRPSAFARSLPLTDPIETAQAPEDEARTQLNLFTGHVAEEGLLGVIDLRGAYAIRPVLGIHDAAAAIHDDEWYVAGDGGTPERSFHWYAEAGFVTLPAQYYYGLPGGTVLQARGELQGTVGGASLRAALMFNDPEQTALYPFSVNNLAMRLQAGGNL